MALRTKNMAPIAAGAVLVGLVVLLAYTICPESEPTFTTKSSPRRAQPTPSKVEQKPLPPDIQRLDQFLEFSRKQANIWKGDARMTRLYATNVAANGSFDREASDIQAVFVSPGATEAGDELNGWRLSVRQASFGAVEIRVHPAPRLDARPVRWCPLIGIVGKDAPKRFTLDVRYANRGEKEPIALAFSRAPERWLVGADPYTCEVRDRSRAKTEEEEREIAGQQDASGPIFDQRDAMRQISAVLASSKCKRASGPSGRGTVQVTFSPEGKAQGVEFLAGAFKGTPAGRCLDEALRKVRVKPWRRGDGKAATRFVW